MYYDDEEIGAATPRLRESKSRELPKRLTGFQLRRRRYRWTGIKNKMRAFPTHYKRWVKSKIRVPLKKTAKEAVQTPADVAKGRRAISRRVSTLPSAPQEDTTMTRDEVISALTEVGDNAGGGIQVKMKPKRGIWARTVTRRKRQISAGERKIATNRSTARAYGKHRTGRRMGRIATGAVVGYVGGRIGGAAAGSRVIAGKPTGQRRKGVVDVHTRRGRQIGGVTGAIAGAWAGHKMNKVTDVSDHARAIQHTRQHSFRHDTEIAAGRSLSKASKKRRMKESTRTNLINMIAEACA